MFSIMSPCYIQALNEVTYVPADALNPLNNMIKIALWPG